MNKIKVLKLSVFVYIFLSILATLVFVMTEDYDMEQKLTIISVYSIFIFVSAAIFYFFSRFFIKRMD